MGDRGLTCPEPSRSSALEPLDLRPISPNTGLFMGLKQGF